MKAIVYMLRKTIKNGIIDILHHPMQLIVYLFIALTTVSGIITAMTSNMSISLNTLFYKCSYYA